jgi:hypothetical protein
MADPERWEMLALQQEFDWIIQTQVPISLKRLKSVIMDGTRHFPMPVAGIKTPLKLDKFVMATASHNAQDSVKCVVTVLGDNLTNADITIKLHKHTSQYVGALQSEWKLQQIQDSANHIQSALLFLESKEDGINKTAEESLYVLNSLINYLQLGRNALVVPKKRNIENLMSSRNMKSLLPALPSDLAVSFYIQAHKLIFAVYLISQAQGNIKFDSFQAECNVPWLSDVLIHYDDALQLCQQLKDKILVFSQYKDVNPLGSNCSSPDSCAARAE